eukprot:12203978-Alexandrium_andersonii.AAC.1
MKDSAELTPRVAMLESILSASIWHGARLLEHGYSSGLCPRCGCGVETAHHRYWQCAANVSIDA